jgi:energy-coupling factor transporter ATP-binding protein EcfA2
MLALALTFFDKLLEKLFLDAAKEKIKDYLDRRNVERKISLASEAPARILEGYFRNERLDDGRAEIILDEVQRAIDSAGVDARMLASASLDADKLTSLILSEYPIPEKIKEPGLEWPFQMALQISADTLCNIGPRFSDWEKETWRRSFEAFDKLLQNQETILQTIGPGGEGTLDEGFENTYRSHVLRGLTRIDASTLRVSSSLFLDLTTVFVQPDVIEIPKSKRRKRSKERQVDKVISLEEARKQIFSTEKEKETNKVKAEEFISKNKRCAIVGLPGSGKTTLLQHLLLLSAKGDVSFDGTSGVVPLFIKVRQLDLNDLPDANDLLEVAEGKVFAKARPGFLQRQFEAGRMLFLIDGLDEVVDDKRDDLMNWIKDFIDLYPKSRYVVSSRPAGYQSDVFQSLGFTEATLCEFSADQIREYVSRWVKAVEMADGASPEEAEEISAKSATTLVQRAEQNAYVRRIATNPLLLSTLCLVQKYEGGDLPNRRVVLYQRCVEGLLFHWDKKRGLPPAILGSLPLERKMMLLRRLALEMQVKGVAEIEDSEVEASFCNSLKEVGEQADAKLILSNIRDRSGLLVERRPWVYGFSHLTFQEYLAALSINQRDYQEYDRLFLFSKRDDPQWAEAIALYAGLAAKDSVESLLKELLETGKPETTLLCGECLAAAQDASLDLQKKVIRALLSLPDKAEKVKPRVSVLGILNSLDNGVVLHEAIDVIRTEKVTPYQPMVWLYLKNFPQSVSVLYEVGERILTGRQGVGYWDWLISLVLLLIEHPDAARALGDLADVVSKEINLNDRVDVLRGLFDINLWIQPRNKETLPGVLKFLDEPDATEEHISLIKYITQVLRFLHLMRDDLTQAGELTKRLEHIAQNGDDAVKEIAAEAAAKLAEMVSAHKKQSVQ